MASDSSVLMVVVMKDGALVGSEVFPSGTYRLGRGADMDLRLEDSRVSTHHASFLFVNGQVGIRDEGSQNGLFVNGAKVKAARLQPRDEVHIPPFTLKLRIVKKDQDAPASEVSEEPEPAFQADEDTGVEEPTRELSLRRAGGAAPRPRPSDESDEKTQVAAQTPAGSRSPPNQNTRIQRVTSPAPPRASRSDAAAMLQPRPIPRSVAGSGAVSPPVPTAENVDSGLHPKFHNTVTVARPKGAVPIPKAPKPGRPLPQPLPPPTDTDLKVGKVLTKPVLRVQVLWGELESAAIVATRTFLPGEAVFGGPSDQAAIPVYGFPGNKRLRLARFRAGKWHAIVPDGAELLIRSGTSYVRHSASVDGLFELGEQESVVVRAGGVAVELISELASGRVGNGFKPQIEKSYWIPMAIGLCCAVGLIAYAKLGPKELPDFSPRALPPIRAILQAPKKKKVEPKPEKKEEKIVQKKDEPPKIAAVKPKPKQLPVVQPSPNLAVQKLLNQTKITQKLFSAVNNIGAKGKMGNNMDYKASGLMGKLPLAMTGAGTALGLGKGLGGGGALGGMGFAGLRTAGVLGRGNVGRRGVAGAPVTIPRGGGKVQGTLPMDAVRKVVDAHMGAIQRCYEGALIRNPSIAGKVTFEWTIGTDGNVKTTKTKVSTLPSNDVVDCIRESLITWHFPQPKGGVVVVSYPFLFNSVGN